VPYYHTSFRKHVPSILKHGLGGRIVEQNWKGCDTGVYLSSELAVAVWVMIDQYLQFGDSDSVPMAHFGEVVFFVIDDCRVNKTLLGVDPLLTKRSDVWLYNGVIDVTNMPVIDFDTVVKEIIRENPDQASMEETVEFLRAGYAKMYE
jgi:hypothetical protein